MAKVLKRPLFANGILHPKGAPIPRGVKPPKSAVTVETAPKEEAASSDKDSK